MKLPPKRVSAILATTNQFATALMWTMDLAPRAAVSAYLSAVALRDMLKQADMLAETIQTMQRMYGLLQQLAATTHDLVGKTHEMHEITNEIRDHIANFEDFWRPIRNYLYWEPHCYDIPICFSLRSIFDSIDGVDEVTDKLGDLVKNLDQIDVIMPQLLSQFPEMIAIMQSMQTMMLTMHSTMSGVFGQMDDNSGNSTAMGKAFDTAQNDDSFYIPPEVFKNPDFQRVICGSRELVRSALFSSSCSLSPEALLPLWSSWVRSHFRWAHHLGCQC